MISASGRRRRATSRVPSVERPSTTITSWRSLRQACEHVRQVLDLVECRDHDAHARPLRTSPSSLALRRLRSFSGAGAALRPMSAMLSPPCECLRNESGNRVSQSAHTSCEPSECSSSTFSARGVSPCRKRMWSFPERQVIAAPESESCKSSQNHRRTIQHIGICGRAGRNPRVRPSVRRPVSAGGCSSVCPHTSVSRVALALMTTIPRRSYVTMSAMCFGAPKPVSLHVTGRTRRPTRPAAAPWDWRRLGCSYRAHRVGDLGGSSALIERVTRVRDISAVAGRRSPARSQRVSIRPRRTEQAADDHQRPAAERTRSYAVSDQSSTREPRVRLRAVFPARGICRCAAMNVAIPATRSTIAPA